MSKKFITTTYERSHDFEWMSLNYAFSYGVILAHSDIKLIPTTWYSHDVEWKSLNYAINYEVILTHSGIKLIPTTWGNPCCWTETSELCLQLWDYDTIWCFIGSYSATCTNRYNHVISQQIYLLSVFVTMETNINSRFFFLNRSSTIYIKGAWSDFSVWIFFYLNDASSHKKSWF